MLGRNCLVRGGEALEHVALCDIVNGPSLELFKVGLKQFCTGGNLSPCVQQIIVSDMVNTH